MRREQKRQKTESPTLVRVCHRPHATRTKAMKNGKPHTSGSLSSTMCDAIINDNKRYLTRNGTRDVMDFERRRQERLSRRRELYRLRMARETPEEREARLIRQWTSLFVSCHGSAGHQQERIVQVMKGPQR